MSPRASFLSMGAVCVLAGAASAQTAPVPSRPTPQLTVPITPTPLDEQTQTALDANTLRAFQLRLKNVPPSLMAYWLDPKNHEAPAGSTREEREFVSPLKNSSLPAGIDRIVSIDPQNTLLIFGTPKAVQELQQTITFLDRPRRFTVAVNPQNVAFDSTIYWIDSLAPDAQEWQTLATIPRVARRGETDALAALIADDRATLKSLPKVIGTLGAQTTLSFAPSDDSAVPFPPAFGPGRRFDYFMPRLKANPEIDPGMQMPGLKPVPRLKRGEVRLQPIIGSKGSFYVSLSALGVPSQLVAVRDGETILLSGSARSLGLTAPSPRFDSFVLCVTPHILKSAPLPAVPEPAK